MCGERLAGILVREAQNWVSESAGCKKQKTLTKDTGSVKNHTTFCQKDADTKKNYKMVVLIQITNKHKNKAIRDV